ncbi:MAG: hypothetical protein V2I53_13950, partial [Paracoccaceae bacterium]|nr:hypothetical protein [Paracoccaceae bacterium]
ISQKIAAFCTNSSKVPTPPIDPPSPTRGVAIQPLFGAVYGCPVFGHLFMPQRLPNRRRRFVLCGRVTEARGGLRP